MVLAATGAAAATLRLTTLPARSQPPAASAKPVCKPGLVWREAQRNDFVCVTPQSQARVAWENRHWIVHTLQGGNACAPGFVWREAFVGDLLCVSRETRAAVREENRLADTRWLAESAASCAKIDGPVGLSLPRTGHARDSGDSEEEAPVLCPTHE
jgi:hypothetical protein